MNMKKIISFILTAVIFAGTVTFYASAQQTGDVNGDGKINSTDALAVMLHTVGLNELSDSQKAAADMNGDGEINSADALAILTLSAEADVDYAGIDFTQYKNLDYSYMRNVIANYREFYAEISADSNLIPIIVSTDQHGLIKKDCEVFKFIDELVDWNRISKIISLGDTVTLLHNNTQLKAFSKAMSYVPEEKRLELEGNHDSHISLIHRDMQKYFIAPSAERSSDGKAFCVKDADFNVRYLEIDPMGYPWTYTSGKIGTEQADFIVNELQKNDSSNIVLLSHTYLFRDAVIKRDGTVFTGSDYFIGGEKKGADVKESFLKMIDARRNGTAGVFTDSDGKEHPYDFTHCEGTVLMSLHGHHHTEGYETFGGFTEFMFQSFRHNGSDDDSEPNCFYFAYIDPVNNKFKCWKNIEGYSAWEIDI